MKGLLIIILFTFLSTLLFSQNKIYTTDGKVIDCQSIQKNRFGVEYITSDNNTTITEYIPNTKVDRIEYTNGDVDYISGSANNKSNNKGVKNNKDFTFLSPHYISLNIGPSIPYGYFAYNYTNNQGYAYTGVNINFDATAYLYRGFGVGFTAGYNYNPFLSSQHTSLVTSYLTGNATNTEITVGGWNNAYLMGGLGYYSEIGQLMMDYKIMIGGVFSYFPIAKATYTDTLGVGQTSIFTADAQGLIYGIQGSIRYYLTRKIQLKASMSMLYGFVNFTELTRKNYQNDQVVSQLALAPLGNYNINAINITFGVAYTLGK